MLLRRLLLCLTIFFGGMSLSAQDVHYTLHNMAPIWLNPAKTGSFLGSIRVGGVYRGQWYGFSGGVQSPNLFADAPIIKGLRDQDWIGVGFNLISDQTGENDITTTSTGFAASYHFSIDKERRNVLTLGAHYANVNYSFNPRMGFDVEQNIGTALGGEGLGSTEFDNLGMNPMGPGGNNNNSSYTDINVGLMLRSTLNTETSDVLELGFAMQHLNTDERRTLLESNTGGGGGTSMGGGIQGGSNSREARERPQTIHAHATLDMALTEKWRIMPTAFYQTSANNNSLSLQGWVGRVLPEDRLLRLGLGYRTNDAIKMLIGFDAGQLRAAMAFDLVQGQNLPIDDGSINAFELSANYIFNIYKKPQPKPQALCPRI
ncbi:MAG: PorP/SprF family type IX secretion system membrane protein [Bacteroidota bacterium]